MIAWLRRLFRGRPTEMAGEVVSKVEPTGEPYLEATLAEDATRVGIENLIEAMTCGFKPKNDEVRMWFASRKGWMIFMLDRSRKSGQWAKIRTAVCPSCESALCFQVSSPIPDVFGERVAYLEVCPLCGFEDDWVV
jgi:hypothetical protein